MTGGAKLSSWSPDDRVRWPDKELAYARILSRVYQVTVYVPKT